MANPNLLSKGNDLEKRGIHSRKLIEWVEKENGCWECTSHAPSKSTNGYHRIKRNYLRASFTYIHRLIYEECFGEIPDDMDVCHKCDNTHCINPEHLFLGTVSNNMQDMMQKGRGNKQKGERVGTAKLKNDDVVNILNYLKQGMSRKDISKIYNVCKSTIEKIDMGINWAWLKKEVV